MSTGPNAPGLLPHLKINISLSILLLKWLMKRTIRGLIRPSLCLPFREELGAKGCPLGV